MSFLQVQKAQELIQTESQLHDQIQQQISQCPRNSEQNLELRQMLQLYLYKHWTVCLSCRSKRPRSWSRRSLSSTTRSSNRSASARGTRSRIWSSDRCSSCISINIELYVSLAGPEGPGVDPDGVSTPRPDPATDYPVPQGLGAESGASTDPPTTSLWTLNCMSFLQVQKAQELIQTESQLQQQISQCPRDSEQNLELRQMLQLFLYLNIELYVLLAGPEGPGVDPDGVSTPRPDPATDQPVPQGLGAESRAPTDAPATSL